jgi:hypothetical protein
MKTTILIFSVASFFIQQNVNAQCTASITNIPHGDCANTDIELTASGGGTANGFSYSWTGPNGFTSTDQFVNIYYAQQSASGIYKVTVTRPSGCISSDSIEIIKHPVPTVYTGGASGGCTGTTSEIYAQDFSGNYAPYTYLWETGATTQTITIGHNGGVYPAPACYMTNMFGCTAANNTTFLIYSFPNPTTPVIEALSATSFCSGGSVTMTTANDPNLTYQWNKLSGIISGETTVNYTARAGGNYFLNASNGMGCSSASNTIHVTVFTKPSAAVTVTGSLNICNGDSVKLSVAEGTGYTYQWEKYGNDILNAVSHDLMVKKKGNYRVEVTNANGCSRLSAAVAVTANCRYDAETRIGSESTLSVYPNPSSTLFNIDLIATDENEDAELIISDLTGRVVLKNTIKSNAASFKFGEGLPAGIYNASLIKNNEVQNIRIVKTE